MRFNVAAGHHLAATERQVLQQTELAWGKIKDLAGIEDQIQLSRRYYNATVRDYNITIQQFPSSLIAGFGRFTAAPFFQADDSDRAAPKVSFS